MKNTKHTPTQEQYTSYDNAFDHFNRELFAGNLPSVHLTFSRKARVKGFYAPNRWKNSESTIHEISLNPDVMERPLSEIMSTLVHEMVHLWQQEFGKPPSKGYHDKQWANKMEAIGLMPSHDGLPSGRRTGVSVTHYIILGGAFEQALAKMPESCQLPWLANSPQTNKKTTHPRTDKIKYTCQSCQSNVWGKSGLHILCAKCNRTYQEFGKEVTGGNSHSQSQQQKSVRSKVGVGKWWDVFGVSLYSSRETVKSMYRKLCREYHPDTNHDLPKNEANEVMQRINEAWEEYKKLIEY